MADVTLIHGDGNLLQIAEAIAKDVRVLRVKVVGNHAGDSDSAADPASR